MGTAADLMHVLRFVGEGKLRPVVDRTLPLAEARAAQGLLADRAQFGKIVLVP
jgi:NADPH:quinone reductase-like Zn-dependent oxidoreductase